MRIRWRDFEIPSSVICERENRSSTYGKFIIEPFERLNRKTPHRVKVFRGQSRPRHHRRDERHGLIEFLAQERRVEAHVVDRDVAAALHAEAVKRARVLAAGEAARPPEDEFTEQPRLPVAVRRIAGEDYAYRFRTFEASPRQSQAESHSS